LKSHDIIREVDGGPVFDSQGSPATLGLEGSSLTLTVETPGQPSREVTLTRSFVEAPVHIDTCLVPGTHIGYIHLLGYEEPEVVNQIAEALEQMSAEGLLQGLIVDTRVNQGGQIETLKQLLSLFTQGELGSFVSRSQVQSFAIYSPLDISGSQTVPLVVLQDQTSGPQAQMLAGVLQLQGRAQIIGESVSEPLYIITPYYFQDGSELLLASATFQPAGKTNQYFDLEGVVPDVVIPSRWDLFTEATDPLLAKAVELLK
jgi:carboxyl-terminal processing protease